MNDPDDRSSEHVLHAGAVHVGVRWDTDEEPRRAHEAPFPVAPLARQTPGHSDSETFTLLSSTEKSRIEEPTGSQISRVGVLRPEFLSVFSQLQAP